MNYINITDICDIQIGKTPKRSESKYWGKGYTWVSIADMTEKYISESKEEINDLAVNECSMKIVPKDAVLMSFKLSIGKVAITKKELYTNEAIVAFIIKDNKRLLPEYLYYALKSYNFDHLLDRAAKGKTLNKSKLQQIEIPLLPMEKQLRIVNIMKKAESIMQYRKQQIEALSKLKQSIFFGMFGDPIINKNKYENKKLHEVCIDILGGGTPSKKVPEYYMGDIPWVTPKDMKNDYIEKTIDYINKKAINNSSAKLIPENSLLMVIRSGILKHTLPIAINTKKVTVNQDIKAFVIDEEKLTIEYLFYYFKAIERYLLTRVRSVTAHNLDFKEVKNLVVPLPNLNIQKEFSNKIKPINKNIDIINNQLQNFKNLYDSLLNKAFSGELFKKESINV